MSYGYLFLEEDLPRSLNNHEIKELFIKYKNGDMLARDDIISHSIRLVIFVVRQFDNIDYELDELVCVGVIGLIKAVDNYDILKKTNFTTFAIRCIKNEILLYLRYCRVRDNRKDSLDAVVSSFDSGEVCLGDTLVDETIDFVQDYEEKEIYKIVRELVENLPSPDKEIIKLYYGFDGVSYSQREVAKMVNLSDAWSSKRKSKALKLLKEQLIECEVIEENVVMERKNRSL